MNRTYVGTSAWSTTHKRLAMIAAAVGLVVACFAVRALFVGKPEPAFNAGEIVTAVKNFCADHRPLPQTVTFSQLAAQGYLRANVLERFGASEVTVFLNADQTYPQRFLMDALMPDGSHLALTSDGSVQRLDMSRVQQVAPTNGGPAAPDTNSGGPGVGGHR